MIAQNQGPIEQPPRPPGCFADDSNVPPVASHETSRVPQPAAWVPRGKPILEMTHSCVPKVCNMAEIAKNNTDETATTLMIRNIPGKYDQTDLTKELTAAGFGSSYDFLYLPIDRGTSDNVGYAFVNFIDPAVAASCMQSFSDRRFAGSSKRARVSIAHLQGLEKNLAHYEKSYVSESKLQLRRPVIIANISKMGYHDSSISDTDETRSLTSSSVSSRYAGAAGYAPPMPPTTLPFTRLQLL